MAAGGGQGPNINDELFRQQSMLSKGGGGDEATTPEDLIKGGAEKVAQILGKFVGINPGLDNNTATKFESSAGGGLSLTNIGLFKDRPGGVLSSILKYFTRDLPAGLAGFMEIFGESSGDNATASNSGGDTGGSATSGDTGSWDNGSAMASAGGMGGGDMPSFGSGPGGNMGEMVDYGGKMVAAANMISDAMDVSETRLGNLQPPAASSVVARGEGMDMGIG